MKFFLEFVSCCGASSRPSGSTTTTPPPAEDMRFLVCSQPHETRRFRSRKRGRVTASRSGSLSEWRPSLRAISEDNIVPDKAERAVVASERILKRKVSSTTRVHVRSYSDDFRRTPLPMMMPVFSPTPFLF